MNFSFSPEEESFRQEVRSFLREELESRPAGGLDAWQFHRAFVQKLAARGWLTMAWPQEWGGEGAGHMKQLVYNEEMAFYDAPANDLGVDRVGPTIMLYGTDEQKQRFLPPIVKGEAVWCQGFSRARLRLRPRVAPDARGRGRRHVRHQRQQDLDQPRAPRAADDPARAHRPRRAEAQGHLVLPARHEHARHRGAAARRHARPPSVQSGLLRQRPRPARLPARRDQPRLVRRDRDARLRALRHPASDRQLSDVRPAPRLRARALDATAVASSTIRSCATSSPT